MEKKRKYAILRNGSIVGESWAVSADKAINNYWWKNDKKCNKFTQAFYYPSDYDAVEI